MATPRSPECNLLLKLLDDHEWHFVDEVIEKLVRMVAPGRAIRRYETNAASRELKYGPRVGPELSDQEKIASGARTMAYQALTSMSNRYIETEDKGDARLCRLREIPLPVSYSGRNTSPVRLNKGLTDADRKAVLAAKKTETAPVVPTPTPQQSEPPDALTCPACGAYVVNPDQHQRWHQEQDRLTEQRLRQAVAEELEGHFHQFRQWMQAFVIGRFASLEVVLGERLPVRKFFD